MSLIARYLALTSLLGAVAAAGCQAPPVESAVKSMTPEYDVNGRLSRLLYDRDHDGTVETWGYMSGTRVIRVEVDENGDGKVDRWEFHHEAGAGAAAGAPAVPDSPAGADKTIERIERATRFDGRITRREFFDAGALTRLEEDTNADGVVDKWETYKNGSLESMALDTSNRGTPDRRLIYRNDGAFDHLEVDDSGSGVFVAVTR